MASESAAVDRMTVESIAKDENKGSSEDPSLNLEKGQLVTEEEDDEDEIDAYSHEHPFPPMASAELETQQLTIRAVLVGCLLGGVISASK